MQIKTILAILSFGVLLAPFTANAEICQQDTSVTERFLPVDLFTGTKWDGVEKITYPEVDRTYPWTWSHRGDEKKILFKSTTSLKGPVEWTSEITGTKYQVYDRVVRNSRGAVEERMTVIEGGTALGRVTDARLAKRGGEFQGEGKYPVGKWTQGQKRTYNRQIIFGGGKASDSETSIEIEKLSCTFDGVPGSVQIRWRDPKRSFSYVFAPGRGMAHVMGDK